MNVKDLLITVYFCCTCAFAAKHTLIAPQVLRIGAPEHVVLNLHDVKGQVTVTATLKLTGVRNFPQPPQDAGKPINIYVKYVLQPEEPFDDNKRTYVELLVSARNSAGVKVYDGYLKMRLVKLSGYLHVQTDRPIYRPEETVNVRVIALTQLQSPETHRDVEIVIRIPLDNVAVEKKKLKMEANKLIETSFKIPEFPVYGIWSIEARYEEEAVARWSTIKFSVRPYVLPTFNVGLELDKQFLLIKENMIDEYITGKITAKYSYGRTVTGSYFLAAKLKRPNLDQAVLFYQFPDKMKVKASIVDGVQNFRIKGTEVRKVLADNEDFDTLVAEGATMIVECSVTGSEEGVIESELSAPVHFVKSPYSIDITRMSKYYSPGKPFEIKADILDSISKKPLAGVYFVITDSAGTKVVKNIRSDANGQINVKVNMPANKGKKTFKIQTLDFDVPDENEAVAQFTIESYDSPSNSILQLSAVKKIANVGDNNFGIDVWHNKNPGALRYVIAARGSVAYSGIHDTLPGSTQTNVKIKITADMVPSFRIFFYYFTGADEIVSNSLWVDVSDVCKKELQVEVPKQVLPGEYVTVEYSGAPNSIIGMSAVDRAAYFLYDESRLTRELAFKKLNDYDMGCVREGGRNGQHVFEEGGLQIVGGSYSYKEDFSNRCQTGLLGLRKKRQAVSVKAKFERESFLLKCKLDGYLKSLTDENCKERANVVLEEESRECSEEFYQACLSFIRSTRISRTSARALGSNAQGFKALAKPRSNFEESILWQTDTLNAQGKLSKRVLASDSITTFEFDTVSVHNLYGFCVAETQNMTIFKNLFIQVYTPYSLKRREQAEIRASVFNYGDKTEKVKVSVKVGKDICSHFSENEFTDLITFDIYPNTAETTSFSILPLRVPESEHVSVQLRAQREDGVVLDWIEKEILVEPEGMLKEDIKGTKAIDLKDDNKKAEEFQIDLRFPEKIVGNSRKCWIYPYSNYMGPIIEFDPVTKQPKNDIRKIIKMPGGCGEQTMLSVGPNVLAHKYLKAVKKMLPGSPEELGSIAKMKSGFANELKYRSTKYGVWAVFTHYEPSTWLNAYVNKIFAQAKKYYIDMDVKPICDSIKWLPSKQEADGGFHTGGKVLHQEMHGAVGTKLSLTSYVIISLLESTAVCPALTSATQAAINKAIAYLVKNENDVQLEQSYALALTTYAMVIGDPRNPMTERLKKKLFSKLQFSPDNRLAFWKGAPTNTIKGTATHAYWYIRRPLAIDVEATSYALLSLLLGRSQADITQSYLDLTRKIVLWLIEQRDANGAFSTTQDTVVGLQALSEYMIWSNIVDPPKRDVEIDLTITGINGSQWEKKPKRIFLDKTNENYTTPIEVPLSVIENRFLKVHAEGTGEGSLSYRCVYRTLVEEDPCHFQLQVDLEKVESVEAALPGKEQPFDIKLKLYISKPEGDPVGQSIVEVNLISGYEPITATLEQMSRKYVVDGKIERYEVAKQKLILYLKDVTNKPKRLAFLLRRKVFVNKPEPSSVTLYSYYEPTVKCTTFYTLGDRIPQLRTTPCKRDEKGKDICECAEGGCLTCRSRKQQLQKTVCSPAMKGKCNICTEKGKCFDMSQAACESNYVYIIHILDDIQNQDEVFVQFRGEIQMVYKMGNDVLAARNQTRKFTARTDCFQKCEDPDLVKGGKDGKKRHFISRGRTLLVMAKAPEQFTDKNGLPQSLYRLDENSYVERIFPDEKCKTAKTETEKKCADLSKLSEGKKKKCIKHIATKQACENLRQLRRMLIKGCDSAFDGRKK